MSEATLAVMSLRHIIVNGKSVINLRTGQIYYQLHLLLETLLLSLSFTSKIGFP